MTLENDWSIVAGDTLQFVFQGYVMALVKTGSLTPNVKGGKWAVTMPYGSSSSYTDVADSPNIPMP